MSATRDKSQKIAFVYSNFYQLYKKGKEAAKAPEERPASQSVLKVGDLNSPTFATVRINAFNPPEFITKRIAPKPELLRKSNPAVDSLKQNLKNLNDLHARLRFMLQELEELVKE